MSRRKTTLYLDEDLLAAAKMVAATSARSESEVVSDAIRAYLQTDESRAAAGRIRALLEQVTARSELSDDEAQQVAVAEVRAHRKQRAGR
jgi:metal-responsive CopG/Arc/MetJ family transcriptional regulator